MLPLRFVTIGLGGYAADHIKAVNWFAKQNLARLVGVIALEQDRKKHPELLQNLLDNEIKLYDNIEHFLAAGTGDADVLTVPIGIHQHVPVSISAIQAGLHVFCEKPAAATIQEVDELIVAQKKFKKTVAIGFQYLATSSIQKLKARICDGRLGKVKSASLMCSWPRSESYFMRNKWAGRLKIKDDWVLDTPANNAHSHFLMNLLFLASGEKSKSAEPLKMQAELFRANHIESADLVQMRFETTNGVTCFAVFSHCGEKRIGPVMQLQCERGQFIWQGDMGQTSIQYRNGEKEEFVNLDYNEWRYEIIRDFAMSILENRSPISSPELARSQTLTINAQHESCAEIVTIPDEFIVEYEGIEDYPPCGKAHFRGIFGLDGELTRAFETRQMFSELGIPWARGITSKVINMVNYQKFPSKKIN